MDEFAAHCLELIDLVASTGEGLVVTRGGEPPVEVVALKRRPLPTSLLGSVRINCSDDELVHFTFEDDWEALR